MATIKHSGEVVRVTATAVYVKMTVNSACSGCHARSVCGVDESAEKIVEVETLSASTYEIGECVEVALQSDSMGAKSVFLAYVVPFLVLAFLLVAAVVAGMGEGVAVLVALSGVGIYYVILYLLRHKIKNKIKFSITKQTK